MPRNYFPAATIDDLMRSVMKQARRGARIGPSKGAARELVGALLELTNPRARLSRTESRGKLFSCLGELCWYLAGSNKLDFIAYYISAYRKFADGDRVFGGYGPRLLNWGGLNQLENVTECLRTKRDSRQAVIQLFDRHDIIERHNDVPCTCTLQFMCRDGKLHMVTHMRSNDAFKGLPHDVFCFTMLQELIARDLGLELGTYKHAVGSLHLYDKDKEATEQFLAEGWQTTKAQMPPMPDGEPWSSVKRLLTAEEQIRTTGTVDSKITASLNPYWADLIRLLQVFRCKKDKDRKKIRELQNGRRDHHCWLFPAIRWGFSFGNLGCASLFSTEDPSWRSSKKLRGLGLIARSCQAGRCPGNRTRRSAASLTEAVSKCSPAFGCHGRSLSSVTIITCKVVSALRGRSSAELENGFHGASMRRQRET